MFRSHARDKFLYHFTSSETALKYIFPSMELRFSPYLKTNDPYETKSWSIILKNSLKEIDQVNHSKKKELTELVFDFNSGRFDFINQVKEKIKVLCFSLDIPDFELDNSINNSGLTRGWGFPRMWAQYGDNHKGICLILDKGLLTKKIRSTLNTRYSIFDGQISYTNKLVDPEINEISLANVRQLGIKKAILQRIENNISNFFFKKALDWRNEREFRYILNPKSTDNDEFEFVTIREALKVIVLGNDIKEEEASKIEIFARLNNIRIYNMDWENSTPMIYRSNQSGWWSELDNPF